MILLDVTRCSAEITCLKGAYLSGAVFGVLFQYCPV